ncbi:MAG: hypothetical protein KBC57_03135 [Neisseriaceae bacterium]|nr:hypothetical protein [Neisseriaceae bacterium]
MMSGWFFKRQSEVKNNKAEVRIKYSGPQTALSDYLKYYSRLSTPGYAVLVTGAWGTGKTYQVKQIMKEFEYLYVSLYGIDSVSGIHDAVLAKGLPTLNIGTTIVSEISKLSKAMGGVYGIAGTVSDAWKILLRNNLKPDKIIIFDDLERSSLWENDKKELLGAINHYVEHGCFRVIVICHSNEGEDGFAAIKEKTFGHTVMALPQIEESLLAFLDGITSDEEKAFVAKYKEIVKSVFLQSGKSSLRILKYLINDIARLRSILSKRHYEHEAAMKHLISFFCALSIEYRSGTLDENSLTERQNYLPIPLEATPEDKREIAKKDQVLKEMYVRYVDSDIYGLILSDEIVKEMLIEGRFNSVSIANWLDQTSYFCPEAETAPWRIVIGFDSIEDDILNSGIARMQKQFDNRSVTDMGEFKHIAALRLMMAEHSRLKDTLEKEKNKCFKYIDDLFQSGEMPPKSLLYKSLEDRHEGYGGYGYWVTDGCRPYFDAINTHIKDTQNRVFEANYPDYLDQVLKLMREDLTAVRQMISHSYGGEGIYADIPIFSGTSAKLFLDSWLSGSRTDWRQITIALDERYKHRMIEDKLSEEKEWLSQLKTEFEARIASSEGLTAFRLKRLQPEIFTSLC